MLFQIGNAGTWEPTGTSGLHTRRKRPATATHLDRKILENDKIRVYLRYARRKRGRTLQRNEEILIYGMDIISL